MLNVLLVDEESHALLALVGYDFLCRKSLVTHGQVLHVYLSATFLNKLGEAVYVTCRTVVVDADNGVDIFLAERTHKVIGTLLHLRVGTLHGVQLYAVAVSTGVHRRH